MTEFHEPTDPKLLEALTKLRNQELKINATVDQCEEQVGYDKLWAEVEKEVFEDLTASLDQCEEQVGYDKLWAEVENEAFEDLTAG